jgi:hypothetical protein
MYRLRGRRMTPRFTPTAPPRRGNLSRDVSKSSAIDFGNMQHLVTTLAAKQSQTCREGGSLVERKLLVFLDFAWYFLL